MKMSVEEAIEARRMWDKQTAPGPELKEANETLRAEVEKRERFEEALRRSTGKILMESDRRRFLSRKLVEILERDRRDMAMYLHDEVGQLLATLKMDLEITGQSGGGMPNERDREAVDKIGKIMNQLKEVSRKLRPDILDTLGLVPALRSLIEGIRDQHGLRVHFYCKEPLQQIDPDKTLTLYRITQEALNNVVKHAQAAEVFVNLIMKKNSFQLSVEDDGIGFDYQEMMKNTTREGPLGLMIMRERAYLVGGEINIESNTGKGTQVVAEIPIG